MNEKKRFTVVNHNEYAEGDVIYYDNGEEMGSLDVVDRLNELNNKNEQLKEENKQQLINFIENSLNILFEGEYRVIEDISRRDMDD